MLAEHLQHRRFAPPGLGEELHHDTAERPPDCKPDRLSSFETDLNELRLTSCDRRNRVAPYRAERLAEEVEVEAAEVPIPVDDRRSSPVRVPRKDGAARDRLRPLSPSLPPGPRPPGGGGREHRSHREQSRDGGRDSHATNLRPARH